MVPVAAPTTPPVTGMKGGLPLIVNAPPTVVASLSVRIAQFVQVTLVGATNCAVVTVPKLPVAEVKAVRVTVPVAVVFAASQSWKLYFWLPLAPGLHAAGTV